MQETWVHSLGWEYTLEEGMATHASILAWRIPMDRGSWLGYVGSQRVRHDLVTNTSLHVHFGSVNVLLQPRGCGCLEIFMGSLWCR